MNLLVDVGNTRIKWAFQYDDQVTAGTGSEYDKSALAALAHFVWGTIETPRRVLVANVAGGGVAEQLSAWVNRRWRIAPEFLVPEKQAHGVVNAYPEPRQLGADRWAGLVAVRKWNCGPACIVDCGTAITVDVLTESGQHLGGLILPGLLMMQQCLARSTSQIPLQLGASDCGRLELGQSTDQAVENGCIYSTVATVEQVVTDVSERLGSPVTTVITGGDANCIVSKMSVLRQLEPDLVLEGLAAVAEGTS